jgi:hypothetical protein
MCVFSAVQNECAFLCFLCVTLFVIVNGKKQQLDSDFLCAQTCPTGQVPNGGQTACVDCLAGSYRGASDASCQTCTTGQLLLDVFIFG